SSSPVLHRPMTPRKIVLRWRSATAAAIAAGAKTSTVAAATAAQPGVWRWSPSPTRAAHVSAVGSSATAPNMTFNQVDTSSPRWRRVASFSVTGKGVDVPRRSGHGASHLVLHRHRVFGAGPRAVRHDLPRGGAGGLRRAGPQRDR